MSEPTDDPQSEIKKPWQTVLNELNARYCVVQDGTRVRVHSFERDEHRRHVRQVSTFLHFAEFANLWMHRTVMHNGKTIDIGRFWLRHPERRQYSGIVFLPGGPEVIDSKMNLWRGWGVEPKSGDWGLMRAHILEVMASGDREPVRNARHLEGSGHCFVGVGAN